MPDDDFTQKLQNLMQCVGISSFKSLSAAAGVSERQILNLRLGKLEQMRVEVLLKLAKILQISLSELVAAFSAQSSDQAVLSSVFNSQHSNNETKFLPEIVDFRREYERLLLMLEQQREVLQQEFQQSSLQILESLLLFWPTAAQKARENPQLEAVKILPLVQKPLDQLLQAWGVEAIASVGAEIPYNPQLHELLTETAQPGEMVKVCYIGYRQGEKLLYRAKVNRL
ncbi:nucleotide exchange factor GrpE [Sphaerospermopsis aphanizomenoides BCCUSP55]|uniref:nucleotide exchange factor GrpE n=1 Tax=Sphaerospermopsis aphanizomenoides TaxID=459663 RepID=UPI000AFE4021|nr:nucleotide exchange factor GrpE [Sphaerospermopsis aphanizomenoides]MBK1990565.1 nucleotide exchange factor GrpE [Sphaerospermopsis aphanizomenoides BCCUSP55]